MVLYSTQLSLDQSLKNFQPLKASDGLFTRPKSTYIHSWGKCWSKKKAVSWRMYELMELMLLHNLIKFNIFSKKQNTSNKSIFLT